MFKDELEEIALVLRNMDAETLQRMTDELMVIYSDKFCDKVQECSIEKILPLQTIVQSYNNPGRVTEEERMRMLVATTVKSADIIPETACYQRG